MISRLLSFLWAALVAPLFMVSPALAMVVPLWSATFTGGIDVSGNITNTTQINSFTTPQGTDSTLVGATFVTSVTGGLDLDRNLWGNAGTEINGAASLVGLDASTAAEGIDTANFFFGQTVRAVPGQGNDTFADFAVGEGPDGPIRPPTKTGLATASPTPRKTWWS
jgi:hypothetical protein